jgi:hypothetical protein
MFIIKIIRNFFSFKYLIENYISQPISATHIVAAICASSLDIIGLQLDAHKRERADDYTTPPLLTSAMGAGQLFFRLFLFLYSYIFGLLYTSEQSP